MLGVGLRKLCPLDSFGYAFRKKNLYENRPQEGPKWLVEGLRTGFFMQVCPTWPPRPLGSRLWAALGALLGRFWRSWSRLGAFWAAPGAFWAAHGRVLADSDDLDDVCGAT